MVENESGNAFSCAAPKIGMAFRAIIFVINIIAIYTVDIFLSLGHVLRSGVSKSSGCDFVF